MAHEKPRYPAVDPSNVDWIAIQRCFDDITDVHEIFYFLRELVDDLKICSTTTCQIFPDLHKLDLSRMSFTDYRTLADARAKITNKTFLTKFEHDYRDFIIHAKSVFSRIFAMKTSKDTLELEKKIQHERFIEIVKEFNKSQHPIPADFSKAMQAQIDQYGQPLNFDDPRLKEASSQMQSQIAKSRVEQK